MDVSFNTDYGIYTHTADPSFNLIYTLPTPLFRFAGPVVMSSDGRYITTGILSANSAFVSNNYGKDWTAAQEIIDPSGRTTWWYSMASSKDGKYIVGGTRGYIENINSRSIGGTYYSHDYGMTWANTDLSNNLQGYAITSSSSGEHFVLGTSSLGIYMSSNYGVTWTGRDASFTPFDPSNQTQNTVMSVTSSGNGKRIVTLLTTRTYTSLGNLRISDNYGVTWDASYITPPRGESKGTLITVKLSKNGKILYLGCSGDVNNEGGICMSTDRGLTWKNKTSGYPDMSGIMWKPMACSENGQYVYAGSTNNRGIYKSTDFGNTWTTINISNVIIQYISVTSSGQYATITTAGTGALGAYRYIANNYTYSYTPIYIYMRSATPFEFTFYSKIYPGTYDLKNANLQTLSTVTVSGNFDALNPANTPPVNSITFTNVDASLFEYGPTTLTIYQRDTYQDDSPVDIQISDPMVVNATCFLEGTKILVIHKRKVTYVPIEKLKPGMLVKTLYSGFIPIKYIGFSTMYNPGLATRVKDQLFKCPKSAYPELIEDLVLTGSHSILVETITDEQRKHILDTLGDIYITEDMYRLPAFNDVRAVPYEHQGEFRIWNLALESDDYYTNYGIYANGLLVETTSCRYLKEMSGMTLVEK